MNSEQTSPTPENSNNKEEYLRRRTERVQERRNSLRGRSESRGRGGGAKTVAFTRAEIRTSATASKPTSRRASLNINFNTKYPISGWSLQRYRISLKVPNSKLTTLKISNLTQFSQFQITPEISSFNLIFNSQTKHSRSVIARRFTQFQTNQNSHSIKRFPTHAII